MQGCPQGHAFHAAAAAASQGWGSAEAQHSRHGIASSITDFVTGLVTISREVQCSAVQSTFLQTSAAAAVRNVSCHNSSVCLPCAILETNMGVMAAAVALCSYARGNWGPCKQAGQSSAHHSNMVEVVDQENGAQLLGFEGTGQLHEQIHACVPHAVQVVIQLSILQSCQTKYASCCQAMVITIDRCSSK